MKYMKYTDISVKKNKKYKTVMCILAVIGVISGCGNTSQQTLAEINSIESPQNVETLGQENLGDVSAETEQESQNSVGTQASGQNVVGAQTSLQERQNTVNAQGNQAVEGTNAQVQSVEQERREPVKVKGIYVSGPIAGNARMDELIELVDTTELNAMVIDIKNDDGRVTYKMDSDTLVSQIGASINYVSDMKELVQRCKEKNIYLIARVVAFKDPYLAQQRPELAVRKKNGDIFYDKSGLAWVNPYNREVWDYLVEIGTQAAEAGFDEVQFDYIRFSTDLKTDKMDFGPAAEEQSKTDVITEFTQYAYDKLSPEGVYVSADVYGTIIEAKQAGEPVTHLVDWFYQAGGSIIDVDNNVTVNSPENANAFNFMLKMMYEDESVMPGSIGYDNADVHNMFMQGKVAMVKNWPYMFAMAKDPEQSKVSDKFAVAVQPAGEEQSTAAWTWGFGISSSSKNKDAAWEFVKWATSSEKLAQLGIANSNPVPRTSSLEIVTNDSTLTEFDKESIQVMSDALKYAHNATENPNFPTIQNELSYTLSSIMTQQVTVEEGLAEAEKAIKEAIQ